MDLGAYMSIDALKDLATLNGIEIPRLRGLRLMEEEEPIELQVLQNFLDVTRMGVYESWAVQQPFGTMDYFYSLWDAAAQRRLKKYCILEKGRSEIDGKDTYFVTGVRWDRIHGKKRKVLKYRLKKELKRVKDQFLLWNQYAGQKDVLYIHARIGGYWDTYGRPVLEKKPWFLGYAIDSGDSTYVDIYAEIREYPEGFWERRVTILDEE